MSSNQDWRILLQEWLLTNPKVISDELSALYQEFLEKFPLEKIGDLTYQDFVSESGYLFWITEKMGSFGNRIVFVDKYNKTNRFINVWAEAIRSFSISLNRHIIFIVNSRHIDRLSNIRFFVNSERSDGKEVDQCNLLTIKLLYLYCYTSFLPTLNHRHVIDFLKYFNQPSEGTFYESNNRLAVFLQE
jgi:hypothetical protein